MKKLKEIREKYEKAAFLIGNGPNLNAGIMHSWKDLLKLASEKPVTFDTEGLTNTEVYDLTVLNSKNQDRVKSRIIKLLSLKTHDNINIHKGLMEFALNTDSPVLTTNFDEALEKSVQTKIFHVNSKGFTHYYPWKSYYGLKKHIEPTAGFGIWKIHGDVRYKESIRLGLTDYMGSVERARKLIHKGRYRLYQNKQIPNWYGQETWLHIWFTLPIIIFGFGFYTDEVFLRWLLIERKRYFNLFKKSMNVTYLVKDLPKPGVTNLLQNLDVDIIKVDDYSEIYG
ncbi:SIR2 family protein [Abyssalbus ytuae]|uniref:SIR2 family protein n=1 Tax=Abyssalbus ytuae TaxID=2926907 RepID=A0A9E7A3F2_9FLAO|nr:SIR2 family protein [Abyssalbus ytuae]UOB19161.1 SIR2 family protein [Abyssalbus ytuae]